MATVAWARQRTLGIDIGSTTAKVASTDAGTGRVVASRAERHFGRVRESAARLIRSCAGASERVRATWTGTAGAAFAGALGQRYVHEVTAVATAARRRHANVRTAIEIGGQDSKLVRFGPGVAGGPAIVRDVAMNDRCAGGTGITIDRCLLRLGVQHEDAARVRFRADRVRVVSSKCGVFAETDLVGLVRAGASTDDAIVSLFDAIVRQTLTILARANRIVGPVLLLGGPHRYFPALADAWRHHLSRIEDSAPIDVDAGTAVVPEHAEFYAAFGACEVDDGDAMGCDETVEALLTRIASSTFDDDDAEHDSIPDGWNATGSTPGPSRPTNARTGLWTLASGPAQAYFVGLDAGSTHSKAAAIAPDGTVAAIASRRSGDSVEDVRSLVEEVIREVRSREPDAVIGGIGVTGYGAGIARVVLGAQVEVVETVAHALSARAVALDADVVCDVGGQDIKILALDSAGGIRDFRMSNQCNAGIGMALEATAASCGIALEDIAERASMATCPPRFGDGCAVFLDADRATFVRRGFAPEEILAGLCLALPRVVWGHVANATPPALLGRTFVLQGGLQRNRAALAAQIDYLRTHAPAARIVVHPYPAHAGALGAALHARRVLGTISAAAPPRTATDEAIHWRVRSDPSFRCSLCPSQCARTRIDVEMASGAAWTLASGNACDAGATFESRGRAARARRRLRVQTVPDLVAEERRVLFARPTGTVALRRLTRRIRIGIPRVLGIYRAAPFVRGYLEALGVAPGDIVFSPDTSDRLWREGASYGITDPCFPVKVASAHVAHLLHREHDAGRPLHALFTPALTHAITPVRNARDCASCPVVASFGAQVRASFEVAANHLSSRGIRLIDGPVTLTDPLALRAQVHDAFGELLGSTRAESDDAVERGFAAARGADGALAARGRWLFDELERGDRVGGLRRTAVLLLARPYHADRGIQHELGEELRALGFPLVGVRSIPRDAAWLAALPNGTALGAGDDPFDVGDAARGSANSGANEQVWAARIAARHGGLGVVDLTSFKCAQDAPVATVLRDTLDAAGVSTCALHDLDETRPVAAMRLRLRTFASALADRGLGPWTS